LWFYYFKKHGGGFGLLYIYLKEIRAFFQFPMFTVHAHVFIPTEDYCENRYLQTSIPKYEMTGSCDFVQSVGIEISEWK